MKIRTANTVTLPVLFLPGEDGQILAWCPLLPGCRSQGKTLDEAKANIREAIEVCLLVGDGASLPDSYEIDETSIVIPDGYETSVVIQPVPAAKT